MICPKCSNNTWRIIKETTPEYTRYNLMCSLCGYETPSFDTEHEVNDYFKAHTKKSHDC